MALHPGACRLDDCSTICTPTVYDGMGDRSWTDFQPAQLSTTNSVSFQALQACSMHADPADMLVLK